MDSFKAKAKRVPGLYRTYRTFRAAYNVARSLSSPFLREVPAGHFYSPLPDMREIARKEEVLFRKETTDCPGVNLRTNEQLRLLDALSPYYEEVPFSDLPDGSNRYYYNNDYFGHGDAIILYAMLRHFKPRRIIEVGSGFSSAVMLDTSEHFLHDEPRFTFIEPYPDRLLSLLDHKEREQYTILKSPVQDVSPVIFQDLAANDILFIDSSHVVKIGSDVPRTELCGDEIGKVSYYGTRAENRACGRRLPRIHVDCLGKLSPPGRSAGVERRRRELSV